MPRIMQPHLPASPYSTSALAAVEREDCGGPQHADAHAPIYNAHQRVFEEASRTTRITSPCLPGVKPGHFQTSPPNAHPVVHHFECGRLSLPQIATNAEATNTSPNSSPHADQPTATMLPPLTRASAVEKRIIGAPQHRANRVGSDRFQRGNEKTPSAGQCRQGLSRFARYLVRAAVTRDLRLGSRTLSGAFTNGMVLEGPTMTQDGRDRRQHSRTAGPRTQAKAAGVTFAW